MDFQEKLAEVFRILDKEDIKTIPVKELAKGLRASGLNPTESQIQQYISDSVLLNGDQIDFTEFKKIAEKCKNSSQVSKDEVFKYFKTFDTNNEDSLTIIELTQALCASGDRLDSKEVEILMRDFDKNNTGKINIKDFVDGLFRV